MRARVRAHGPPGGGGGSGRASVGGRHDGEAEPAEVLVEGEARHPVEERRDHDEGDRVAEREAVVAAVAPEDLEGRAARLDAVLDQVEAGPDVVEEAEGGGRAVPVPEEGGRLADHVPRRPELGAAGRRRAGEPHRRVVERVVAVGAGVEVGRVAVEA